jgi:gluconolactonase
LILRLILLACAVVAPSMARAEPTALSHPVPVGSVERLDPALAALVPDAVVIERVATGFRFAEGPVWTRDGSLLFSDIPANRIYKWTPAGGLTVFRDESGYSGADVAAFGQPGSNGLTLDRAGRLTIAEHGNRRVTRLDGSAPPTVLADRWDGKRLNSPNDLVYKSDGALYFTDPPFGLPKGDDDPRKELPYSGVYRVAGGVVQLLTKELAGPNGVAFSPDEHVLYVGNWDPQRRVIMRYPLRADGTLDSGEVWLDLAAIVPGWQAFDGLKVDRDGNVYAAAPGGVWIVSPEGRRLGIITLPEQPANFAWGDADGRTLYVTAQTGLYRVRLAIPGIRP